MEGFIIINLLLSFYCCFVMLLMKLAGKRLSPAVGCYIYVPLILLLILPFVPNFTSTVAQMPSGGSGAVSDNAAAFTSDITTVRDLYISVDSYRWLFYIWAAGAAVEMLLMLTGLFVIRGYMAEAQRCDNSIFNRCLKTVGINAELYVGDNIKYPFSLGVFKRRVVIPRRLIMADDVALRHIFLHELTHHKHRDILLNYFICILNAVYWFNPFVRFSLRKFRLSMEIYCDNTAAAYDGDYLGYGSTVIQFASNRGGLPVVSNILGSKRDIRSRIISLSKQGKDFSHMAGRMSAVLTLGLTLITGFAVNSFGYSINDRYDGDADKINYIDFSSYFDGDDGCFVLYDISEDSYLVYNKELARKRTSPYSTYKPFIALNALENGVITAEENFLPWDGREYYFDEWNKDQNLETAMANSVNWYFTRLDSNLGRSQAKSFLKYIGYGNCSLSGSMDSYWLEGSLKVSSIEQARLYAGLYTNEFNCKSENIAAVTDSLDLGGGLYGKTGTGQIDGKTVNGWFNGVFESDGKVYGFSCRIESDNGADGARAADIAQEILSKNFS